MNNMQNLFRPHVVECKKRAHNSLNPYSQRITVNFDFIISATSLPVQEEGALCGSGWCQREALCIICRISQAAPYG